VTELRIVKLARSHAVETFDCGVTALNRYLIQHALGNQLANAAQTYVCVAGDVVAGYATLAAGSVEFGISPERLRKGLARHPISVLVLARLAVDENWQGQGIAASLIKDAVLRTIQTADVVGVRAIVVHAKNETVKRFYVRFGFLDGFPDPLHLYVLTKDAKSILSQR
jgi:GNAT superfamily N-acetyltransferase